MTLKRRRCCLYLRVRPLAIWIGSCAITEAPLKKTVIASGSVAVPKFSSQVWGLPRSFLPRNDVTFVFLEILNLLLSVKPFFEFTYLLTAYNDFTLPFDGGDHL